MMVMREPLECPGAFAWTGNADTERPNCPASENSHSEDESGIASPDVNYALVGPETSFPPNGRTAPLIACSPGPLANPYKEMLVDKPNS